LAVHVESEAQVVGGKGRPVVPGDARLEVPRGLHRAVGRDGPQAILDGWQGLRQPGMKHVLLVDVGEPAVQHRDDLAETRRAAAGAATGWVAHLLVEPRWLREDRGH